MDQDWDELQIIPHPGLPLNSLPVPPTALAFDVSQELLWVGNQFGRITSFYGPELQRYTSYSGHTNSPVTQILANERGIISLSAHSIHLASRTGPSIWHLTNDNFRDLKCMILLSKGGNELLVAGCQSIMFKIDIDKGNIIQSIASADEYILLKKGGQYICAATANGALNFLDSKNLEVVKRGASHSGMINDMDANSDFLVTCSLSHRQQHGLVFDPLANVYDLKTLTQLSPIPFQPGAAFVRMHPRMSTTSIVVSQNGQLQVVDIMNPHAVRLRQAHIYEPTCLTCVQMAPSGEALALTSTACNIHIWGSPSKLKFAEYSNATVFPDTLSTVPSVTWSNDVPLNSVGLPFYRDILLSAWPPLVCEVGGRRLGIDDDVISNMKRGEIGYYASNPRKQRPNQVEYLRIEDQANPSIAAPKFLSEKATEENYHNEMKHRRMSDALDSLDELVLDGTVKNIPLMYRNVEIKYSKFGVDDFDFRYFNKTKFSGLETHIANSYANPLLQLYRFIPVVRNLALRHTATSCLSDGCLLCELGFLADMLEKAAGQNCQASNFLKALSAQSAAAPLNLLEENSPNSPLTSMIQAVNRFLLDKFCTMEASQPRRLEKAFATRVVLHIRCAICMQETIRSELPLVHDLTYPSKNAMRNMPRSISRISFSQILKASVERQDQTRGWCPRCRKYQILNTRQQVENVPSVLMINAAVQTPDAKQLWATTGWLPQEIGVIVEQGQFFCYEGQDLKLHIQRGVYDIQVYQLVGLVAEVNSGENQKPHLVSLIDVALSSSEQSVSNNWHLFNDFLVRDVQKEDALRLYPSWKLPSVLAYQLKSANHIIDDSWKDNLDTSILYTPPADLKAEQFQRLLPLLSNEAPTSKTVVGIDAEFVSLQQEEIEVRADGSRATVRPSRLGLARVSVLRGDGPDADAAFIDDYIAISEPVVDYLTAFSGICPGDLDKATSNYSPISLKIAYKKLWLLLNLGCIFVGHGLLKDFRTINIHVPRGQVVDTVDLWHLSSQRRKLNLRFLAWLLLHEDIQTDAHDSVEDARTALRLWRKYVEIQKKGKTKDTLDWIYRQGRDVGFRAPGAGTQTNRPDIGRNFQDIRKGGGETLSSVRAVTPLKSAVYNPDRTGS